MCGLSSITEELGHVGHRALVLDERVREQVEVVLVLVLHHEHHLGRLGDLVPEAPQALGLLHQLKDLVVEVDVQLLCRRVAHEERRLQPALGRLDASHPRKLPERLKLDHGARDLVVHLDGLLRVLELHELLVVRELLHGLLDAPDELARPELSAPMPN